MTDVLGKTKPYKQDLPPKGGYAPITFERIPARSLVNAKIIIPTLFGVQFVGYCIMKYKHKQKRILEMEERSSKMALEPMLCAEKDRVTLKEIRRLRDVEEDLMKDVPGWEVGTYFGHPIFKTDVAKNPFYYMNHFYFYMHSPHLSAELEMNLPLTNAC